MCLRPPGSKPRTMSSDTWKTTRTIESREVTTSVRLCVIAHPASPLARVRTTPMRRTEDRRGRTGAVGEKRWGRRLHLPEHMQVVAAHWQDVCTTLEMNFRRFIVVSHHMADRMEIDHHRPVDLRETIRIELFQQLF